MRFQDAVQIQLGDDAAVTTAPASTEWVGNTSGEISQEEWVRNTDAAWNASDATRKALIKTLIPYAIGGAVLLIGATMMFVRGRGGKAMGSYRRRRRRRR